MGFLNLTPDNNSESLTIQSRTTIPKASERGDELQERSEPFLTSPIFYPVLT
jgi:hypothetical protein